MIIIGFDFAKKIVQNSGKLQVKSFPLSFIEKNPKRTKTNLIFAIILLNRPKFEITVSPYSLLHYFAGGFVCSKTTCSSKNVYRFFDYQQQV